MRKKKISGVKFAIGHIHNRLKDNRLQSRNFGVEILKNAQCTIHNAKCLMRNERTINNMVVVMSYG